MKNNFGCKLSIFIPILILMILTCASAWCACESKVEESKKAEGEGIKDEILEELRCPITGEIMVDPKMANDGQSYEGAAIERVMLRGNGVSPLTRKPLSRLIKNVTLKNVIQKYCKIHGIKLPTEKEVRDAWSGLPPAATVVGFTPFNGLMWGDVEIDAEGKELLLNHVGATELCRTKYPAERECRLPTDEEYQRLKLSYLRDTLLNPARNTYLHSEGYVSETTFWTSSYFEDIPGYVKIHPCDFTQIIASGTHAGNHEMVRCVCNR